jgi:hypothetical protein
MVKRGCHGLPTSPRGCGTVRRLEMKEMIMSKLIPLALLALLLSGPAAMSQDRYNEGWTDTSELYGGFDPNSQEGIRAFWEYMSRRGGR